MKHIFIIPEPHLWDKSFKNRRNYPQEIFGYLDEIVDRIASFEGDKIVIFPGDVFHRCYKTFEGLIKAINFFAKLNTITNSQVYSCVGNHELSYASENPFWILAEDTTGRYDYLKKMPAYSTIKPGIKITDHLDVGNLRVIMGHYERSDYSDDSMKDLVVISHNSIVEKDITNHIQEDLGRDCNVDYMQMRSLLSKTAIPVSHRLKYVFVGHMHTFYSSFTVEETVGQIPLNFQLQYLGSIGRTSISEIDDSDLERTIPHFVVDEDGTYDYEPFVFFLRSRSEIVMEDIVMDNKEKYQAQKTIKHLQEANVFGDTALHTIMRSLDGYPDYLKNFSQLYYNQLEADILSIIQEGKVL